MEQPDNHPQGPIGRGFLRYAKDNPLAMVASALIISMLVARFAFLGGSAEDAPPAAE